MDRPSPTERAEREALRTLLAALADPPRAGALLAGDAATGERLLAVARHHRLSPLLDAACRDTLPPALAEVCRRDRAMTTARNLILTDAAEELVLAFGARGIDAVLLKGLAYESELYLEHHGPGCRPTADVDILVREAHRRPAFQVLSDLGYEPRAAAPGFDDADYHEVAWSRGPASAASIDLHMALAPLVRCGIDYQAVWADVRPLSFGRARAFLLARAHAAVFHALHMAIDHFDVPALYLVDMARLLPDATDVTSAVEVARAWRCARPLATSLALTSAFLPNWHAFQAPSATTMAERIRSTYGSTTRVPRREQIRRKFEHFDSSVDALRYVTVQAGRNARELFERHLRRRSARARLGMAN